MARTKPAALRVRDWWPRLVTMTRPRPRGSMRELPAERVVDVDHTRDQVVAREQPGLGGAVALHGAVVVEMIAREIGERGGAEAHRADARLVERVRGDFHRDAGRAAGAQVGERALHGDGVAGGQRARDQLPRPARADGAHVGGRPAGVFQRLRQ